MTALTGQSVANTYKDLIHLNNGGDGVDATSFIAMQDGNGTALPFEMKQGAINFSANSIYIAGTALAATAQQLNKVAANLSVANFKANTMIVPEYLYVGTSSSDGERMRIQEVDSGTNLNIRFLAVDSPIALYANTTRVSAGVNLMQFAGEWSGTAVATMNFVTGNDTSNKDDGKILFQTAAAGTVITRMRIENDGKVMVGTTATPTIRGGFHVHVADSTLNWAGLSTYNTLVLEDSGDTGIYLAGGSGSEGRITYTDDSGVGGFLAFNHTGNYFYVNCSATNIAQFNPDQSMQLFMPTQTLKLVDSGDAGATELAWIQVEVSDGNTGYLRVFSSV